MWNWTEKAQELKMSGTPFAIATICNTSGSGPRKQGTKMIVMRDGQFFGTIGGGNLEKQVLEDCLKALQTGDTTLEHYPLTAKVNQCCGGTIDVLIEVMGTGPRLFIFGAGHVAQAICHTLQGTPFELHIFDSRKEWLEHPNFPSSVIRHQEFWDEFILNHNWDQHRDYAVVLTHDHGLDFSIIEDLIRKPRAYVGLIGSQTKWNKFQHDFKTAGFSEEEIATITCPIGIGDLGHAPQEVAISFAAELLGLYRKDHQE